jgi:hypothetical protein
MSDERASTVDSRRRLTHRAHRTPPQSRQQPRQANKRTERARKFMLLVFITRLPFQGAMPSIRQQPQSNGNSSVVPDSPVVHLTDPTRPDPTRPSSATNGRQYHAHATRVPVCMPPPLPSPPSVRCAAVALPFGAFSPPPIPSNKAPLGSCLLRTTRKDTQRRGGTLKQLAAAEPLPLPPGPLLLLCRCLPH